MNKWQTSEFWQFSLSFYTQPNVKDLCLALQDDHHLNVNLLLLCCYLTHQQVALDDVSLVALLTSLEQTNPPLLQMREQRRSYKNKDEHHYRQLLANELELEQDQQAHLIEVLNEQVLTAQHPQENLQRYARVAGVALTLSLEEKLRQLASLDG